MVFVLVGGWPGSGKSTLAAGLAPRLGLALLSKDALKERFATGLGYPRSLEQTRAQGRLATLMILEAARGCPGAVLEGTWFDYARPLVHALPGPVVEVVCRIPADLARSRYRTRMSGRDGVHLDRERSEEELWGTAFTPLGVGTVLEVDTSDPVDLGALTGRIAELST